MKIASLIKFSGGVLLAFALTGNLAKALPIAYGDINFAGTSATLGDATDLTTTSFTAAHFIKTVTDDTVTAGTTDGDYSALTGGETVSFSTPFDFVSLESVAPTFTEPLWTIISGGVTYSFTVLGNDVVTYAHNTHGVVTGIDIQGDAIANITGFNPNANATYNIQIGTAGASIGFQVQNSAPAVPDSGATALLIGLGVAAIGLGLVTRRRASIA